MKTIKFTIREDGSVLFDFDGFQGNSCLAEFQKLLKELEELGIKIEGRETKMKTGTTTTQTEAMKQ
jgi:hypothetical protein